MGLLDAIGEIIKAAGKAAGGTVPLKEAARSAPSGRV